MKCLIIPVIIGATGIVTAGLKISANSTRKAFSRLSIKAAVIGTLHLSGGGGGGGGGDNDDDDDNNNNNKGR